MARAYLDHSSTSPLRPVALEAMLPYLREHHADPGRLHAEGHATRVAIEDAREQVAGTSPGRPADVGIQQHAPGEVGKVLDRPVDSVEGDQDGVGRG